MSCGKIRYLSFANPNGFPFTSTFIDMQPPQESPFEAFSTGQMTEEALYFLESAGKWAKFLAILGFIGAGILVMTGLSIVAMGSMMQQFANLPFPVGLLGAVYLVIAGVYILPVLYLFRFANHATNGLRQDRAGALTEAMRYLRAHYRFLGVAVLVGIGLNILAVIAAMIIGGLAMAA